MNKKIDPGLTFEFKYTVPVAKTVPEVYSEAPAFRQMPRVFATGFMVALMEWACVEALMPYLDWPAEQTVGTRVDVSHTAATPPGLTVTVTVKLVEVDGRRLVFELIAHDGVDEIGRGRHERFVIDRKRFDEKVAQKAAAAGV